jgi:hypothetical protein
VWDPALSSYHITAPTGPGIKSTLPQLELAIICDICNSARIDIQNVQAEILFVAIDNEKRAFITVIVTPGKGA